MCDVAFALRTLQTRTDNGPQHTGTYVFASPNLGLPLRRYAFYFVSPKNKKPCILVEVSSEHLTNDSLLFLAFSSCVRSADASGSMWLIAVGFRRWTFLFGLALSVVALHMRSRAEIW